MKAYLFQKYKANVSQQDKVALITETSSIAVHSVTYYVSY